MKKTLGIFILLVLVCIITTISNKGFFTTLNVENLIQATSLFGIISIGAAFVIISGGIDLSIGSVVCLVACLFPYLLVKQEVSLYLVILAVTIIPAVIGLTHGLLITKIKLQPFIVTLCGLLAYRGIARGITKDETQSFRTAYEGLRYLAIGKIEIPFIEGFRIPVPFLILIGLALVSAFFLNLTTFGRHLKAIGNNETAARYSGINTDRVVILAYVICSLFAGLGGVLFAFEINNISAAGIANFYELYAIAAAVLGGCSIRGGEGSILGVIFGAALLQILPNSITMLGIPSQVEFAIIGLVILIGVTTDELVKRYAKKHRVVQQSKQSST